jgi:phosphate-selective porin OprO/OprP
MTVVSQTRRFAIGLAILLTSSSLMAQTPQTEKTPGSAGQPPATPSFTAGWQDGFTLQSPDGDYRLTLGLVAQLDGRFSVDDPTPITNTFTIRKARPTLTGRVARYFDFKVMPDFGNGNAVLADAYFEIRFSQRLRIRTGKDKTPVGYELLMGDAFLLFPERAQASNLVPNRDVGVQAQGDLAGGKFHYAGGVFNGVPDGASSGTDVDTNNAKDFAGRIVLQPFRRPGSATLVSGLGFHFGGSAGQQEGALPFFRTSVGQTYFSYATDASAAGSRTRVSPAVFYYFRTVGAFAEYMQSTQKVRRLGTTTDVTNHAWEVTGSVVLTGEAATDRGLRPRRNFDPAAGQCVQRRVGGPQRQSEGTVLYGGGQLVSDCVHQVLRYVRAHAVRRDETERGRDSISRAAGVLTRIR